MCKYFEEYKNKSINEYNQSFDGSEDCDERKNNEKLKILDKNHKSQISLKSNLTLRKNI